MPKLFTSIPVQRGGVRQYASPSLPQKLGLITITQEGCPYDHHHQKYFDSMSTYAPIPNFSNFFFENPQKMLKTERKNFALRAASISDQQDQNAYHLNQQGSANKLTK